MSDTGWQQSILQGIGTRIEVFAELYPRTYLLFTSVFAVAGYACLLLFPLLVLAGVVGMYQSLTGYPAVAWLQLLGWLLVAGFSGLASYRIFRFSPALPAGIVLERQQAPSLFELVDDTVAHYGHPGIDRIVMTGAYQLDIVNTPRSALPLWSTRSVVIGLPLMQCLSTQRFSCLLARRLGQSSKRTNPLVNWLYGLREIWPRYLTPAVRTDLGCLLLSRIFSIYAPLYTTLSTAAARVDELHADSYAMELFSDEEVLDAITTDTVYRLFLREKYWPAIRKLGAQDAVAVTKIHTGMVTVLHAGLQQHNIGQWVEKAMSMEQQADDPWPLLARRLDNIGHAYARMDANGTESAIAAYLASVRGDLEAALEDIPPPEYPRIQPWSVRLAGLQQKALPVINSLLRRLKHTPQPGASAN
jgi:hypothetical protein